jgi:hypothetical protein
MLNSIYLKRLCAQYIVRHIVLFSENDICFIIFFQVGVAGHRPLHNRPSVDSSLAECMKDTFLLLEAGR